MKYCLFILLFIISVYSVGQERYFSAGLQHSVYICSNGDVFTWGDNYYDQLGRNSTENIAKNDFIDSAIQISAGLGFHTLILREDRSVWAWGTNNFGQLGNGDCDMSENCNDALEAQQVLGGETGTVFLENVLMVSAGEYHSMALLQNGEVVTWGDNTYGQLGNSDVDNNQSTPVYVVSSTGERLSDIIAVTAGAFHSYALTTNGLVYAWGNNTNKQLADGSSISRSVAILMRTSGSQFLSGIVALSGGGEHGLFLHESGRVFASGAYKGIVSDGVNLFYYTEEYAKLVTGGETNATYLENVKAVSSGYFHCIAIVEINGINYAMSWGDNKFYSLYDPQYGGQLGTGISNMLKSTVPVFVKTGVSQRLKNVTAIGCGGGISLFETIDPVVREPRFYVCGANNVNQLGIPGNNDSYFATALNIGNCMPLCPKAILGNDKALCAPIMVDLYSGSNSIDYSYKWYKDDELLGDEVLPYLSVDSPGKYGVHIADKIGICPLTTDDVLITQKTKDFYMLPRTFCGTVLTFEVYGNGYYEWYSSLTGDDMVGIGTKIILSKEFAEEIIADSIYRIWIEEPSICQRLPVYCVKKCDACNWNMPAMKDTNVCRNTSYSIHAEGEQVFWFRNATNEELINYGNTYEVNNLLLGDNWFYVNRFEDYCESGIDSFNVVLEQCLETYYLKGNVYFKSGDTGSGNVRVYYNDNFVFPYATKSIKADGGFDFIIEKGMVTLSFEPDNSMFQYDTLWFGNTYNENDALLINMQTNVIDVKLDYTKTTNIKNPNIDITIRRCNNKLYVVSDEMILEYAVFAMNGSKIMASQINEKEFVLDITLPTEPCILWLKTENAIYTYKIVGTM